MTTRSRAKHAFRIATLVAPSWLAWYVACSAPHRDALTRAVSLALGPFWVVLAAVLVVRTTAIVIDRRRHPATPLLERIDVLTGSGSALAWLSACMIMGAVWIGWASLAVVGLLGTALFHVVVLFAFAAFRGPDPMRAASVTRRFSPEVVTEGDAVVEEIHVACARIPIGSRLFVTGRMGPRWATTRHVLDATESDAEIVLEADVGPAIRGEHEAEPLEIWLEDTFGLCRSRSAFVAPTHLTVMPRLRSVEKTEPLLDRGIGPRAPRPARRLPTEGSMNLREYQPGDDVRRIHWVRSLSAGELVVRLPDELPPDRPRVRVVLDTFFPEAFALACDAPSEILDALVAAWLAVARALTESGARVTLVAAVPWKDEIVTACHDYVARSPAAALRLGAQIGWQSRVTVEELLTDEATFVVARGVLAEPPMHDALRWIVVIPPIAPDLEARFPVGARMPFPMGSPDNRWSRQRRVASEHSLARRDHSRAVLLARTSVARPPPGSFIAVSASESAIRLEAIR